MTDNNVRNNPPGEAITGLQVPRPAAASPMRDPPEGQRRSNRGQLESTRRSIKNALYTMRDVMQDDDMTENMQNSFQVNFTRPSTTPLYHIVVPRHYTTPKYWSFIANKT